MPLNAPNYARPYVILSVAQSLDGIICRADGNSRFSPEADLIEVHKLRSEVDAILVGVGTVLKDDPRLTVHKFNHAGIKNPVRIVFDSTGKTPLNSKVLSDEADTIIFVSNSISPENFKNLKRHANVICCGEREVDLKGALSMLKQSGIRRLMVEGGGKIISSFIESDCIDEMRILIAPEICGEGVKISNCSSRGRWSILEKREIEKCVVLRLGREIETN